MIPVHMQIKGFLSYREEVNIDFSRFSLACISGSNGAGKSSLLDAMTWVLFGNARRSDDSVINTASDSARVILEFLYEGATYRVAREKFRNKTGTLEFNVRMADGRWNVLTAETMRMTEAKICETLKMDYDTFINASFFLQGKADQFAQQKPAERKKILGSILGLERWEAYKEEAINRRKAVKAELDQLDGRLNEIQTELGEEEERRKKLAAVQSEYEQVAHERATLEMTVRTNERLEIALKSQKESITRMENDLKAVKDRRDQQSSNIHDRQQEIEKAELLLADEAEVEKEYTRWETMRSEKERLEVLALRYHQLESQRNTPLQQIAEEKGRLQQEAAGLERVQDELAAFKKNLKTLEDSLPALESQLATLTSQVESRPAVESERQLAQDAKTHLEVENSNLKSKMDELREHFDKLQAVIGADCPLCGQELTADHRQEMLTALEKEGRAKADAYRANLQVIKEKAAEISALENRLRECDQAQRESLNVRRALDQALANIEMLKQKIHDFDEQVTRAREARALLETEQYAAENHAEVDRITREMNDLGFDSAQLETVTRQEAELRAVAEKKQAIAEAHARLEPLKRELTLWHGQLEESIAEISQSEVELNEARLQLEEQSSGLPDLTVLRNDLATLRDREIRLNRDMGAARQNVEVLDTLRLRQMELSEKRKELTLQIDRLKQLEKAFSKDGVQALLIEEALPEIESQANEILEGLSGGSMSVQFATQKEYKDRNRDDKRETLDILISDDAGSRAYELFSGGEAFRVNFAIRLALSRILAKRAGARLQTLVIDEGFGSQDVDGRQRLIETINQVKGDFARILVITHLEELKDAFPARIEVEKTAHGSKVNVYDDYS